ncbi:MAG: sigma-70 family RNA polymerase sigma factor [Myxococcota bacterium]
MTIAISAYGPELLGFLKALHRRPIDAQEVFGEACMDMWRGIGGFDGRSTFRAWAYAITRNAHHRYLGRYLRRARQHTGSSALAALPARVRTETAPWRKTENKDRLERLRQTLEPDEQMLLVLRLDRGLSWSEIGEVLGGGAAEPALQSRRAATARKRFERLRARLKQLALQEGLISSRD